MADIDLFLEYMNLALSVPYFNPSASFPSLSRVCGVILVYWVSGVFIALAKHTALLQFR